MDGTVPIEKSRTRSWSVLVTGILFVVLLSGSLWLYLNAYQDPRYRTFDPYSYQATYGDVYNVAEIPIINDVRLVGRRRLEFRFLPEINADGWRIESHRVYGNEIPDGTSVELIEGKYPQVQFPDVQTAISMDYHFIPGNVSLNQPIKIRLNFEPKEKYEKTNLSWPDNYHVPPEHCSVPLGLRKPYSISDWVDMPDTDPDLIEARKIISGKINPTDSTIKKIEDVISFISSVTVVGYPSDEMQDASPMKTWELMRDKIGEGGWCENHGLVYYLFANAAGIPTRYLDAGGMIGPLKLAGHGWNESWVTEENRWVYVDPVNYIAHIRNEVTGLHLNTYELTRLANQRIYRNIIEKIWNPGRKEYSEKNAIAYRNCFYGDTVIAYRFGYPRNPSYSKLKHFLFRPTPVLCDFKIPDYYVIKNIFVHGTWVSFLLFLSFVILSMR